jgi:hypothetical protein
MVKAADPEGRRGQATNLTPRSWRVSALWAAIFVGAGILLSATVNPLFGRSVHWDWMAGLAPTLFTVATVALRRRWV